MNSGDAGNLREFLRAARERIAPHEVGFPVSTRRRSRGLRREEVAELAGISENWYARFETGRAQLSFAAIERVANVLRLGRGERERLLELARPDYASFSARGIDTASATLGSHIHGLHRLVRACSSASSFGELATVAAETMHGICGPETLAYVRRYLPASEILEVVGSAGPGAEQLFGHRQATSDVAYAMRHFVDGQPYGEADLDRSPCADLRRRVERIGVRAYYTQPILTADGLGSMIGVAFGTPREPDAVERSGLEAAAALIELTLKNSSRSQKVSPHL
jgi:transcriptional regulator with XRE-family HTH domain